MIPRTTYTDISLAELEEIATSPEVVVVDVRETWEFEEFNIGGLNIPLAEIREHHQDLQSFQSIIVVCTNGTRSRVAAKDYCRTPTFREKKIYHLKGGILEVDDFS